MEVWIKQQRVIGQDQLRHMAAVAVVEDRCRCLSMAFLNTGRLQGKRMGGNHSGETAAIFSGLQALEAWRPDRTGSRLRAMVP